MKDQSDPDINNVYCKSAEHEYGPYLADVETAVLAELVVKRCRDVLEGDDLLFGKPSDRDLEDRDAAVTDERKSYDKISKRDLKVDRVVSDEESQSPGTCIAHKHLTGIEVEDQVGENDCDHDET